MTKAVLGIIGGSGLYDLPGPGECARGAHRQPVGRAVGAAPDRRYRRAPHRVHVAPRQGPPAVADRHQLSRQYRRDEAGRGHRPDLAVGLRLVQGGAAARHVRAGRSVRRSHLSTGPTRSSARAAWRMCRWRIPSPRASPPSRRRRRRPRASRWRGAAPMSASRARNSPRWPRASPIRASAIR